MLSENRQRVWASTVIDQLVKMGATHFYLSPGMRNAPLIAAVQDHPKAIDVMGIDERAHAYRCLGHGKASGRPGVLICTSGTAHLNYAPAIAEAHKSQTPMFVISADRPPEMVWGNANQTVQQTESLVPFLKEETSLPAPSENFQISTLSRLICHLYSVCMDRDKGPVHLNMPFIEPLDGSKDNIGPSEIELAQKIFDQDLPYCSIHSGTKTFPTDLPKEVLSQLAKAKNPIISVGELPSYQQFNKLQTLLDQSQIPFFVDITSGMKSNFTLKNGAIPTLDHPEVVAKLTQEPPDLILHFGGRLISKFYYRFLQNQAEIPVVHFSDNPGLDDPAMRTNFRIQGDIEHAAAFLLERNEMYKDGQELKKWNWGQFVRTKADLIESAPLTYPSISKYLMERNKLETLYLGNSTVIRSFDNYSGDKSLSPVKVLSHRGASGIEGFVSAAMGAIDAGEKNVTLVLGDLSLLHDLNSLLNLKNASQLKIILVNNKGGGIFNLLPAGHDPLLKGVLDTPHEFEFKDLCRVGQVKYFRSSTTEEFKQMYELILEESGPVLLEAIVDDKLNQDLYQKLKTVKI